MPTKIMTTQSPAKKLSITATEYEGAIRDWFISEVTESPRRFLELAKFLFSISAATVTALIALEKFYEPRISYKLFGVGMTALFFSIIAVVTMMIPKVKSLGDINGDLVAYFESHGNIDALKTYAWVVLWLLGTFVSLYALRYY